MIHASSHPPFRPSPPRPSLGWALTFLTRAYTQHTIDIASARPSSTREGYSVSAHGTRRVSTSGTSRCPPSCNTGGTITAFFHQYTEAAYLSELLSIRYSSSRHHTSSNVA